MAIVDVDEGESPGFSYYSYENSGNDITKTFLAIGKVGDAVAGDIPMNILLAKSDYDSVFSGLPGVRVNLGEFTRQEPIAPSSLPEAVSSILPDGIWTLRSAVPSLQVVRFHWRVTTGQLASLPASGKFANVVTTIKSIAGL